jgi:hypothetical protein
MVIEKLQHFLEVRIIEAFTAGMSVIEIIRAMGRTQVGPVHTIIRKAGYIRGMTTDEHFSSYEIDFRLDKVLTARGYSFVRWCLGWKFDPDAVVAALKSQPDENAISAVHEAVGRDFPKRAYSMFQELDRLNCMNSLCWVSTSPSAISGQVLLIEHSLYKK